MTVVRRKLCSAIAALVYVMTSAIIDSPSCCEYTETAQLVVINCLRISKIFTEIWIHHVVV
jgi:hypothetical protein